MISIISPVYNSKKCLKKLVEKIIFFTNKITNKFEIILVDDGSEDKSWSEIKRLKKRYKFIKGIKLKENYGQQIAIFSGIKYSIYDLIIIMDCDLQDSPAYIIKMYNFYIKKKKPVIIQHQYNGYRWQDRILSVIFWYFLSFISLKKFYPSLGNFMLINKKIKKKYLLIKKIGYLYGDLIMQGNSFFYIKKIRPKGIRRVSTYNFKKLLKLALLLIFKYNILTRYILEKKNKLKISIQEKL
jgi:glycosyltransferase involved in cell wall biosynthesis